MTKNEQREHILVEAMSDIIKAAESYRNGTAENNPITAAVEELQEIAKIALEKIKVPE